MADLHASFADFKNAAGGNPIGIDGSLSAAHVVADLTSLSWGPQYWGWHEAGESPTITQMPLSTVEQGGEYHGLATSVGGGVDVDIPNRASRCGWVSPEATRRHPPWRGPASPR